VDRVPKAVALSEADLLDAGHSKAAGPGGEDFQSNRKVLERVDAPN